MSTSNHLVAGGGGAQSGSATPRLPALQPALHPPTLLHRLGNDYRIIHAIVRGLPHSQNSETAAALAQLMLAVASSTDGSASNLISEEYQPEQPLANSGRGGGPGSSKSSAAGSASPVESSPMGANSPATPSTNYASPSRSAVLSSFLELLLTMELEEHLKGSPHNVIGFLRGNSVPALVIDRLLGGGALPPAAVSVPIYSSLLGAGRVSSTSFVGTTTPLRGLPTSRTIPNSTALSKSNSSAALATLEGPRGASSSSCPPDFKTEEGEEDAPIEETVMPTPVGPKEEPSFTAAGESEAQLVPTSNESPKTDVPTPPPIEISRPSPLDCISALGLVAKNDAEGLTPELVEEGGRHAALRLGALLTALKASVSAWPTWILKALQLICIKIDKTIPAPPQQGSQLAHSHIFLNTVVLLRFISPKIMQMVPSQSGNETSAVSEYNRKKSEALSVMARIIQKVANNQPCLPNVSVCSSPKAGEEADKLDYLMTSLNESIKTANRLLSDSIKHQIEAFYEALLGGGVPTSSEANYNASVAHSSESNVDRSSSSLSPNRITAFPLSVLGSSAAPQIPLADLQMRRYLCRHLLPIVEDMNNTSPLTSSLHGARVLEAAGYFIMRAEGPIPKIRTQSTANTPQSLGTLMLSARPRAPSHHRGSSGDPDSQWVNVSRPSESDAAQMGTAELAWEALVRHGCACMQRPVMMAHAHQFVTILGPTKSSGLGGGGADSAHSVPQEDTVSQSAVLMVHGDLLYMSEQILLKDSNRSKALQSKYLPLHKGGAHPLDGDLLAHLAAHMDLLVNGCKVKSIILAYVPAADGLRPTFGSHWLKTLLSETNSSASPIPPNIFGKIARLVICRAATLKERVMGAVSVSRLFTASSEAAVEEGGEGSQEGSLVTEYIEDPAAMVESLNLAPNSLRACSLPIVAALAVMTDPRAMEKVPSLSSFGPAPHLSDVVRQLLCALLDVATRINCLNLTQNLFGTLREADVEWFRQFSKFGGGAASDALENAGEGLSSSLFTTAPTRLCGAPWGFLDEEVTQDQRARFVTTLSVVYREVSVPRSPAHWPTVSLKTVPLRPLLRVALGLLWAAMVGKSGEDETWLLSLAAEDRSPANEVPTSIQLMAAKTLLQMELTRFAATPTEQSVRTAVLEAALSVVGATCTDGKLVPLAEALVAKVWPSTYTAANHTMLFATGAPQKLLSLLTLKS